MKNYTSTLSKLFRKETRSPITIRRLFSSSHGLRADAAGWQGCGWNSGAVSCPVILHCTHPMRFCSPRHHPHDQPRGYFSGQTTVFRLPVALWLQPGVACSSALRAFLLFCALAQLSPCLCAHGLCCWVKPLPGVSAPGTCPGPQSDSGLSPYSTGS